MIIVLEILEVYIALSYLRDEIWEVISSLLIEQMASLENIDKR